MPRRAMCGVWSESCSESSVPVRIASAISSPPYIAPVASAPRTVMLRLPALASHPYAVALRNNCGSGRSADGELDLNRVSGRLPIGTEHGHAMRRSLSADFLRRKLTRPSGCRVVRQLKTCARSRDRKRDNQGHHACSGGSP